MSHVVAVKLQISDIDALKNACERLGLTLRGNGTANQNYKWFGSWVKDYHANDAAYKNGVDPSTYGKNASYVISVAGKNAYEVGLHEVSPGMYAMAWDFYGSQGMALQNVIGKDGDKLIQTYLEEYGKNYAAENEWNYADHKQYDVMAEEDNISVEKTQQVVCVLERYNTGN